MAKNRMKHNPELARSTIMIGYMRIHRSVPEIPDISSKVLIDYARENRMTNAEVEIAKAAIRLVNQTETCSK